MDDSCILPPSACLLHLIKISVSPLPPLPPLPPDFVHLLLHSHCRVASFVRASLCPTKHPRTQTPISSSVIARIFRGCLIHPGDAKLLSRLLKTAFRGLEKAFLPTLSLPSCSCYPYPTHSPPSLLPPPQLLLPSSHPPCHGVSWLISQ